MGMDKPLLAIHDAIEALRRAYAELATEVEICLDTAKQLRRDISEGREREAELRAMLREAGLASYDESNDRRNHVSNNPENR